MGLLRVSSIEVNEPKKAQEPHAFLAASELESGKLYEVCDRDADESDGPIGVAFRRDKQVIYFMKRRPESQGYVGHDPLTSLCYNFREFYPDGTEVTLTINTWDMNVQAETNEEE